MLWKSSVTTLSKNLLLSIPVAEGDEIGVSDDDCKDETVKRLSSENLNEDSGYITPDTRQDFT